MKKLVWLLLVSTSLFSRAASSDSAAVAVCSDPSGLTVYIDHALCGLTPLQRTISAGQHLVRVARPDVAQWGQTDYFRTITVDSGDTVLVQAGFPKTVFIQTIPYGAAVFMDNMRQGVTPLVLNYDSLSEPLLRIEKEGYETIEKKWRSIDGSQWKIPLEWKSTWLQQQQIHARQHEKQLRQHRRWMVLSLAVSALSGLATIRLRDKGNEAYRSYLATASPARMDHYYQQTQKYDRYSTAAYALFELSFVLGGYHFFASRK